MRGASVFWLPSVIAAGLAVTGPAAALEIGLVRPGQDFAGEARGVLEQVCARLVLTDNALKIFITCDLRSGDLMTANASVGGAVYWITYRSEARMPRSAFVQDVLAALDFEGEGAPCGSGARAAECWTSGSLRLEILNAPDPAGRWVVVEQDESLVP